MSRRVLLSVLFGFALLAAYSPLARAQHHGGGHGGGGHAHAGGGHIHSGGAHMHYGSGHMHSGSHLHYGYGGGYRGGFAPFYSGYNSFYPYSYYGLNSYGLRSYGTNYYGFPLYPSLYGSSSYPPLVSNYGLLNSASRYAYYPQTSAAAALMPAPPTIPIDAGLSSQRGRIELRLPRADARVWMDGHETTSTGPVRSYSTPDLAPGGSYTYQLLATWQEDGQEVRVERTVNVVPGQTTVVDLTRANTGLRMPPVDD